MIQRQTGTFHSLTEHKSSDKQTLFETTAMTNNLGRADFSIENSTVKTSLKVIFIDREYELYMRLNPELTL